MSRIEAVFVDVGGVLVVPDPGRVTRALSLFRRGLNASRTDRAHYAGVAALTRAAEGDRDAWVVYHRAYVRSCGIPHEQIDEAADALLDEFLRPPTIFCRVLPGAAEALRALTRLGVEVAIVSNSDGSAEALLRALRVCQVGPGPLPEVRAVFDSALVGVEKPDPRIFEHALAHLGIDRGAAIHVGDTPVADVAGALAAGITPVLVDPYGDHPALPHATVQSLAEVPALVAALDAASQPSPPGSPHGAKGDAGPARRPRHERS